MSVFSVWKDQRYSSQIAVDTITAWDRPWDSRDPWEYISRREVQDVYDDASVDLKKALGVFNTQLCYDKSQSMIFVDFIISNRYVTYLTNDMDRRKHEFFHRRDVTGDNQRSLLSSDAFIEDFESAHVEVQKAIREYRLKSLVLSFNLQD